MRLIQVPRTSQFIISNSRVIGLTFVQQHHQSSATKKISRKSISDILASTNASINSKLENPHLDNPCCI